MTVPSSVVLLATSQESEACVGDSGVGIRRCHDYVLWWLWCNTKFRLRRTGRRVFVCTAVVGRFGKNSGQQVPMTHLKM